MKTISFLRTLRGFTLIELLVVITIIAVLAGIALPVYNSILKRGHMTQDMNNLRQIGLVTRNFITDHSNQMIFNSGTTDGYWKVVSGTIPAQFDNETLYPNYLPMFKGCKSPFDARPVTEQPASSPISYSFNANLINPTTWNRNVVNIKNSRTLILAAANYTLASGLPTDQAAWGSDSVNVPINVSNLPVGGAGMKSGPDGAGIFVLFVDGHTERLDFTKEFQDSTSPDGVNRWVP